MQFRILLADKERKSVTCINPVLSKGVSQCNTNEYSFMMVRYYSHHECLTVKFVPNMRQMMWLMGGYTIGCDDRDILLVERKWQWQNWQLLYWVGPVAQI